MIKRVEIVNRRSGVQKYFREPRNQDQDKNEHVIAFQPAPDRFKLGDLEAGQNQIFAHEFFPFALKHLTIFHHHRDEKMRFKHAEAGAEGVVKPIAPRFNPEQYPNNGEIEKKMMCGTSRVEKAMVIMAVLLVIAQFVVTSSRCRQTMIRPISPR